MINVNFITFFFFLNNGVFKDEKKKATEKQRQKMLFISYAHNYHTTNLIALN